MRCVAAVVEMVRSLRPYSSSVTTKMWKLPHSSTEVIRACCQLLNALSTVTGTAAEPNPAPEPAVLETEHRGWRGSNSWFRLSPTSRQQPPRAASAGSVLQMPPARCPPGLIRVRAVTWWCPLSTEHVARARRRD